MISLWGYINVHNRQKNSFFIRQKTLQRIFPKQKVSYKAKHKNKIRSSLVHFNFQKKVVLLGFCTVILKKIQVFDNSSRLHSDSTIFPSVANEIQADKLSRKRP